MIENLANMIKFAYFSDPQKPRPNTKQFRQKRPPRLLKYCSLQSLSQAKHAASLTCLNHQLQQLTALISSEQKCQNWLFLLQKHKHNHLIQRELYQAIQTGTVTVHNLFLMLIQCHVLPDQVWIPIEQLCRLRGDSDNELCCLVHYTVLNMGRRGRHLHNPVTWTRSKARLELGAHFVQVYNKPTMALQEMIAILPMLTVLNAKNSPVLWSRLPWLDTLPTQIMHSVGSNLQRLLQDRLSAAIAMMTPDYFVSRLCIKSIQLLQVQGFVSAKNLFQYTYELYNLGLVLELLAGYRQEAEQEEEEQPNRQESRERLNSFVVWLLRCMDVYEYDIGARDLDNLKLVIIRNRLYMLEIDADAEFLHNIRTELHTEGETDLARLVTQCSSEHWCALADTSALLNPTTSASTNTNTPATPQSKLAHFCTNTGVLTCLLSQLYRLRTEYLLVLAHILQHCYDSPEEPYSELPSSMYRLQLYLLRHWLMEFLVDRYAALETRNSPVTMVGYYRVWGLLVKGNPIAYGKLDSILLALDEQTATHRNSRPVLPRARNNTGQYFCGSFLNMVALSRPALFMLLADQFEWKENEAQAYPNAAYESVFVRRALEDRKVEWMVTIIRDLCVMYVEQGKNAVGKEGRAGQQGSSGEGDERVEDMYQWCTLLLVLYYYFEQTVQACHHNKQKCRPASDSPAEKITTPHRTYLEKLHSQEQFMEILYPTRLTTQHPFGDDAPQPQQQARQQRILNILIQVLDQWQQYYNHSSKKGILQYGYNYPMLRVFKKKLRSRVGGFVKTKEYEENGEDYFNKIRKYK